MSRPLYLRLVHEHPHVALFLAIAIAYAALATISFEFFGAATVGTAFFPPAGLTVVALYRTRVRRWPAIFAAIAVAEAVVDVSHGQSWTMVIGFVSANSLEPLLAVVLLRRINIARASTDVRSALKTAGAALVAGPALGAAIGATTIVLTTPITWSSWIDRAWGWGLGDALGVLIIAPLLLVLLERPRPSLRRLTDVPTIGLVAAVVVFGVLMYATTAPPTGYLAIPILAWTLFRFSRFALALVAAALTSVSTSATAAGRGHWASTTPSEASTQLANQKVFWLLILVGAWALAGEVRRRRASVAAAHTAEERLDQVSGQMKEQLRLRAMSEERSRLLRALAQARSHGEVAATAFDFFRKRFSAKNLAIVALPAAPGGVSLATAVSADGPSEATIAPRTAHSLHEIANSGRPQFLFELPFDSRGGDPMGWGQNGSLAVLPSNPDETAVTVLVGWDTSRRIPDDEQTEITALAQLVIASFDRVRRQESHRVVAEAFQETLFDNRSPSSKTLEIATRYLSGTDLLAVGGDWYDAVSHDDGRVSLMIGDVVGKGLRAATAMGQLRLSASALVGQGDPAETLSALDSVASESDLATFATMAIAVVDPEEETLHYAFAGHPPGLVRDPGGNVTLLDDATSPPLGVASDDPRPVGRIPFPPGSALALFTDGFVERPGEAIDTGLARLRGAIYSGPPNNPEALAEHLVEVAFAGSKQRDDAALLCGFFPPHGREGTD